MLARYHPNNPNKTGKFFETSYYYTKWRSIELAPLST